MKVLGIWIFTVCLCLGCAYAAPKAGVYGDIPDYGAEYLSPEFIVRVAPEKFLVTARTGDKLLLLEKGKVKKSVALAGHPSGVAVLTPSTALVTIGAAKGLGQIVDFEKGEVLSQFDLGHAPRAPLLCADKKSAYILNQFTADVLKIEIPGGRVLAKGRAIREPFDCALSKDGRTLFVLNQLPEAKGGLYEENIGAAVSVLDAETLAPVAVIDLPNGAINAHSIVMSADGNWAYCTAVIARFNVPTSQVERGWVNTNAVHVIDARANKFYAAVLLDDIDLGAANPYGLALSDDGNTLFAAHAGTHEISVIDLPKMHAKLADALAGKLTGKTAVADPANDLTFLFGMRKRVDAGGLGPRRLACDGGKVYATLYYSDCVSVLDGANNWAAEKIDIGGNAEMTEVRKGDLYFHDGSLCFQKWLSCATCHTEVRSDALNWDLMNDGIGNPKQSKSLLFAHFTPPSMITGIRKDAETAVRKGIRYIQFAERPEEDAKAIDEYLKSLYSVDSPHLMRDGKLSEAAERGEVIFDIAKCGQCHSGEYLTNGHKYDVGSGLDEYENFEFDTPTLREVWRTAPYLYDGRAKTIFELFKNFNKDNKHGDTANMTDEDLKDLEAYVLSL